MAKKIMGLIIMILAATGICYVQAEYESYEHKTETEFSSWENIETNTCDENTSPVLSSDEDTPLYNSEDVKDGIRERLAAKLVIVSDYLSATGSEKSTKDFVMWLENELSYNIIQLLGEQDEENLKKMLYEYTGKSIYLLCDEFTESNEGIKIQTNNNEIAEFLFAGDICLTEDGFVLDYYDTRASLTESISPEIIEFGNKADVFMINNEFTLSERGNPLPGKLYTFRGKPERVNILKELGVNLVSLANNHVYDFGIDAFSDTMSVLSAAGINYIGGGNNLSEASRVIYYEFNGMKVGIVSASRAEKYKLTPGATESTPGVFSMYDDTELKNVVSVAAKKCDYLIAYLHWGTEDSKYFEQYQHDIANVLIDLGVDAIIGSHPHILQGMEYIKGKPVIYSLGDFWFNGESKYTGMIDMTLDINGLRDIRFIPCIQTGFSTVFIKDEPARNEIFNYLNQLSAGINIDSDGMIKNIS